MTENEYWSRLEYRLCREMDGVEEWHRSRYWCDDIYPNSLSLEASQPRIEGEAWIGTGAREQQRWTFEFVLPRAFAARDLVPWAELLPADDVTGWLEMDVEGRRLRIEPGIAVPDGT
jgi:hypothetical protein